MRFKIFCRTVHSRTEFIELQLPEHCIEVCITDLLQHPGGRSDIILDERYGGAPGLTCRSRDMAIAVIPRATNTVELIPTPFTREPEAIPKGEK